MNNSDYLSLDAAQESCDPAFLALGKFRLIYGSSKAHFYHMEKACGLSGAQVWALAEVCKHGPMRLTQLARYLSVKQPTCSNLVEKLVNAGMLRKQKDPDDSRAVLLEATDAGRETVQNAPAPLEGILPAALRALPPEQLAQLNATLDRLISVMAHANPQLAATPLANF